ncbi:MAG TPA: phosphoribosylamine--glycine ligase [Candidatus Limnocylindrales bacterium]|nr:phosphoribosylamine--glycine ligase [Candidatus Limnocylindrales bacterium]
MNRALVQPTRILIVGGGGREHALAWKLAAEPGVNEVLVAPGSAGIATEPRVRCETLDPLNPAAVVAAARRFAAELVVVGPEAPLAAGVADALADAGFAVFGPHRAAARIESSKAFCREIAEAAGVPMARGRAFAQTDPSAGLAYAMGLSRDGRIVVKADGLAAGKGVTVCNSLDQAARAISDQPDAFVVEERLAGPEASVIALCDGRNAIALPISRDHKRLGDGDTGPNTGGMGAISPLDDLPDVEAEALVDRFHRPVLAELARRGAPFRGALYAGLILTADGPRLLEFNARFGDPETQAILPRLATPLGPLLLAAARGRLAGVGAPATLPGAACAIVLASAGYPSAPEIGRPILGLEAAVGDGAIAFHAATDRAADGGWQTAGGRVLSIVARGASAADAARSADRAAGRVDWPGMQRRHDIGLAPAGAAR